MRLEPAEAAAIARASGSSARAAAVGTGSRPARSKSARSSSASSPAIAMLTAEGTRPSARAAAENDPWSSTERKIRTVSLVKAIRQPVNQVERT